MNIGNALRITKLLVLKIFVSYMCSPATELAIKIIQGSVIVLKSSPLSPTKLIPACSSVSIPSDPVFAIVYIVGYTDKNLYTKLTPKQKATTL